MRHRLAHEPAGRLTENDKQRSTGHALARWFDEHLAQEETSIMDKINVIIMWIMMSFMAIAALDRMMREHLEYLADMPLGSFGDGA